MTCSHCGMACTANGENMSLKTFKKAMEHVDADDQLSIGGGEPTVHPLFWDFLGLAITKSDNVWMATNGKITSIALRLAAMAQNGVIACELSQDPWHEKIDSRVVRAFTKNRVFDPIGKQENDKRGIRSISERNLIKSGRCDHGKIACMCQGSAFVKPDGKVYQCGCLDSPCVGDVFKGFAPLENNDYEEQWQCHKDWMKWKKVIEGRDFTKDLAEIEIFACHS